MKHSAIFLLAAAAIASVFMPGRAQQTRLLTADRYNDYGLVYSLPVTKLCVSIDVKRTVRRAGPFYQYAKKYLGSSAPVEADEEIWEIGKVTVRPYGVPDSVSYQMQLKPGALTSICVDADGMLLSVNKECESAPALPQSSLTSTMGKLDTDGYLKYVNEDFLASQSSAKRAQILSESLLEIRDSRLSLTRGTAETMPVDGRQLELMLDDLSKQEAAMTAAFLGMEQSENLTGVFTFYPEDEGRFVLTRLSDFGGFVDADDYSGEPIYIKVEVTREGEAPVDEKGEPRRMPKDAVAYCVPGSAAVSVSYRGDTLYSGEFDLAQFGTVFGLAPSIFTDKKSPSFATFDPATGALKEIGELQR